jgi:glycosyltransferase involved in cell wall biosynthesis
MRRSDRGSEIPSFACERLERLCDALMLMQADNPQTHEGLGLAHTSARSRECAESTPVAGRNAFPSQQQLTVSIIIKALNEEHNIAAAIESAFAALGEIDGEVILADGSSSDRTVEIARRYPIVIVQLNRTEDRSCGSGAQLGFQYSRGRYLLLMDGDMRVQPGFLPVAIEMLARNPGLAGVGGAIIEPNVVNEEYEQRRKRHPGRHVGRVTRLDSSGLYRRAAIESIGYLTDRNHHGGEEFDLGARLHCAGWTLVKIDQPIVHHEPHMGSVYRLLLRRVFNRNARAPGELVRAAMARRYLWFLVRKNRQWLVCLLVTGWWVTLFTTVALPGSLSELAAGVVLLLPLAVMSLRWRSFRLGLYSVATANTVALCFWSGFLQVRIPPARWIESTVLQSRQVDEDRPTYQSPPEFRCRSSGEVRGPERLET